jgi:hypothetical protein
MKDRGVFRITVQSKSGWTSVIDICAETPEDFSVTVNDTPLCDCKSEEEAIREGLEEVLK